MRPQLAEYGSVLMLVTLATVFTGALLGFSILAGKLGRRSRAKDTAYECGMIPAAEGSGRLTVRFYLVAMLFILFDIEVVFLYPWAVVFRDMLAQPGMGDLIYFAMLSFIGVLGVGYVYAARKGAFDWR